MAEIIDGKVFSKEVRDGLKLKLESLYKKTAKRPVLAVVLIGEDPASQVYVKNKIKACAEIGVVSREYIKEASITENELLAIINELNNDADVNGILVQLPLPKGINEKKVINAISPEKDVDGFHPVNIGKVVIGDDTAFMPCTPHGCHELIKKYVPNTDGLHVVVVGRSNIVGKPMANIMVQKNKGANCIVTVCHSASKDISKYTLQADILIAAVGVPEMIKADMVKEGAVVIDVGVNRIPSDEAGKTKLVGDVDFENVSKKVKAISPVPGGVGPVTIAMLMKNTVKAFCIQNGIEE
jgi:methylenetetrahydrofolate dehydrogenase (NADP+)/methenyltetrahydrofolate cyclohydrolase